MLKFLLIVGLLIFLFGRLFKFLLKYAIIGMAAKHGQQMQDGTTHQANPSKNQSNSKGKGNGKGGGEYIDYEIIK